VTPETSGEVPRRGLTAEVSLRARITEAALAAVRSRDGVGKAWPAMMHLTVSLENRAPYQFLQRPSISSRPLLYPPRN